MDQFGASPVAQPHSVLGQLAAGGQTPMSAGFGHFGAPFFGFTPGGLSSLLQSAHGPPSVLTTHSFNNPPNSVLMERWEERAMGGPPSVMMNLGGSVAAASISANSNYAEPQSVSGANANAGSNQQMNLIVPMTPLAGGSDADRMATGLAMGKEALMNAVANALPASNIPAFIPATPMTQPIDVPSPTLQNIVSTVNLGVQLDLKQIALRARNAEYNPKRFAAVIMRIRDPRTTALIFSSGKMVCTGAKSEETSRLAARKYARIIQKLGFDAKFTEFKVQNMVGSCDVKFPIQLEGLCITHAQFSTYEPELFPGLIYRMVKPRVVLLIFVSGKVVITGAKYRRDIDQAFSQIYPILKGFKK